MGRKRQTSQDYSVRDTILYALGVGAGIDANTADKLRFVYEEDLDALPTMAVVLATPGFWLREPQFGIAWQKVLHAEQSLVMHKRLPLTERLSRYSRWTPFMTRAPMSGPFFTQPGSYGKGRAVPYWPRSGRA